MREKEARNYLERYEMIEYGGSAIREESARPLVFIPFRLTKKVGFVNFGTASKGIYLENFKIGNFRKSDSEVCSSCPNVRLIDFFHVSSDSTM
jgi:hypothetical protein